MVITADGVLPFESLTPANIEAGIGTVYLSPFGTAMPADTVNMGVNWATGIPAWVPQGATQAGSTVSWTPQTQDLNYDESELPGNIIMASADLSVSLVLTEDVIANIRTAFGNGSLAVTAPGASIVGKTRFTPGLTLNQYAMGIEMAINQQGTPHWRRISIPSVISVGSPSPVFGRTSQRMYACQFRANCLPTSVYFDDKTAESTS